MNHAEPSSRAPGFTASFEWPTWLLILSVYGSWLLFMQYYHALGAVVAMPLLAVVCALHGSLCHELIHGHPTRSARINALIGSVPLTLFLPYPIYRDTHLAHHHDENITIPGRDPESYYCSARDYERKSKAGRIFAWINMTIAGRLLFNPALEVAALAKHAANAIKTGDAEALRIWGVHLLSVALLMLAITRYFEVPWWHYLAIAYFANSLTRIRSFYEHRARNEVSERTVLMEPCLFFRLLFLNLNYHLAHHEHPAIPWYRLQDYYRDHRQELIDRSGNFHYDGYRRWLIGFLFKPVDSPVHPFYETGAAK